MTKTDRQRVHNSHDKNLEGAVQSQLFVFEDWGAITHERGLLTGSIPSPFLYADFMDDLAGRLRSHNTTKLHEEKIKSFYYADDIAMIADSLEHLQAMLNTCTKHASQLGYQYASAKCKIVAAQNTVATMNGVVIENVANFTHLGVLIGHNEARGDLFAKATAAKANRTIRVLRSVRLNGSGFSMKLIQAFVRPQLEYGLALMGKTHARPFQRALNYALRAAVSVPPNTSSRAL